MSPACCVVVVSRFSCRLRHPRRPSSLPPAASGDGSSSSRVAARRRCRPMAGGSPTGSTDPAGTTSCAIRNIASGTEKTVAFGTQPTFTADSKWIVYSIGYSEAQEERMRTQRRPIQRKLGLLRLDGTSEPVVIDGIESFNFDPSGSFVAMRRYAPVAPRRRRLQRRRPLRRARAAAGGRRRRSGAAGVTVIVRELATGRDTTFGNVAELAWQSVSEPARLDGRLLALTISAEDKTGNGVHLYDPRRARTACSIPPRRSTAGSTWRRDADDLVVLARADRRQARRLDARCRSPGRTSPASHRGSRTLDPRQGSVSGGHAHGVVPPSVVVGRRRMVFLGMAEWAEKPASRRSRSQPSPPATGARRPRRSAGAAPPAADDSRSVDIWHARDVDVMPRQKLTARADRQRNLLAAWHLDRVRSCSSARLARAGRRPSAGRSSPTSSTWDGLCDGAHDRPAGGRHLTCSTSRPATRTKVAERRRTIS